MRRDRANSVRIRDVPSSLRGRGSARSIVVYRKPAIAWEVVASRSVTRRSRVKPNQLDRFRLKRTSRIRDWMSASDPKRTLIATDSTSRNDVKRTFPTRDRGRHRWMKTPSRRASELAVSEKNTIKLAPVALRRRYPEQSSADYPCAKLGRMRGRALDRPTLKAGAGPHTTSPG
jgi:hypothetical protein